jgi:hypothetical protein
MKRTDYLSLSEAEKVYGVKPDTLKRRCQKGRVRGAVKQGKMWFVPQVPNIDPEKPITENYPNLNFDASMQSNLSLYDAEADSKLALYPKFNNYIFIWEYGFYFLSLFIQHSSIHKSYITLAALFTEAQSSLRSSFLLNLQGYHPDAIALLRRTHESTVRAIACKIQPQKMWSIIMDSSIQKAEHSFGVSLKTIYRLESSFTHSNTLKSFQSGIDLQSGKENIGVAYGPQINDKEFSLAAKISIFWMYTLIRVLPSIFPKQVSEYWLSKQQDSAKLLKDYLMATRSSLAEDLKQIDTCLSKIT